MGVEKYSIIIIIFPSLTRVKLQKAPTIRPVECVVQATPQVKETGTSKGYLQPLAFFLSLRDKEMKAVPLNLAREQRTMPISSPSFPLGDGFQFKFCEPSFRQ